MLLHAILFAVTVLSSSCRGFTPFDVVDDYVGVFEYGMQKLKETHPYEEPPASSYLFKDVEEEPEEYDFIIVGSGASGSAIASRLSELPEWKVLLLEAGVAENDVTAIPAAEKYLQTTPFIWQYKTVPQNTSCLGTENYQCAIGTGRALGGDSSTNEMLYIRGNPKDYDTWADEGLLGWCWRSVFPYFKKVEDAYCKNLDRKYHHYGGPVSLENPQFSTPLSSHILQAAHELGIKEVDYNGKEQLGFGLPQFTTKDGKRYSAASAYLTKAHKRSNLVVKTSSRVTEVIISEHTKEARGVKYYHDGKIYTAKASKEVILAAGAINTAQLLLLSGIGPKSDLEALEIPVVSELEVGRNLKDHVSFIGLNFIINSSDHHLSLKSHEKYCQNDMTEYLRYGKGPMTTNGIELVGFLQTEASKSQAPYPDVQLLITRDLYNQGYEHLKHLNIRKDIYDAVWAPLEGKEGFRIELILLHPKSTGYVKLHGKDPFLPPIINPNSLSDIDNEDAGTILAGIQKALKLVEVEYLQKHGVHLSPYKVPGCGETFNDEYWRCAIKYLSVNSRHLSGTAKMGAEKDKEAVVDKNLRVKGVYNLRVADSSVIPVSVSGNLLAANFMIGEQAAEKIRKEWLKEKCQCEEENDKILIA